MNKYFYLNKKPEDFYFDKDSFYNDFSIEKEFESPSKLLTEVFIVPLNVKNGIVKTKEEDYDPILISSIDLVKIKTSFFKHGFNNIIKKIIKNELNKKNNKKNNCLMFCSYNIENNFKIDGFLFDFNLLENKGVDIIEHYLTEKSNELYYSKFFYEININENISLITKDSELNREISEFFDPESFSEFYLQINELAKRTQAKDSFELSLEVSEIFKDCVKIKKEDDKIDFFTSSLKILNDFDLIDVYASINNETYNFFDFDDFNYISKHFSDKRIRLIPMFSNRVKRVYSKEEE